MVAAPQARTRTMTFSRTESRQSIYALLAALPLTAALISLTVSLTEFVV